MKEDVPKKNYKKRKYAYININFRPEWEDNFLLFTDLTDCRKLSFIGLHAIAHNFTTCLLRLINVNYIKCFLLLNLAVVIWC